MLNMIRVSSHMESFDQFETKIINTFNTQ